MRLFIRSLTFASMCGAALALSSFAPSAHAIGNAATQAQVDPSLYQAMQWRGIGPYRGGRALAVTGITGDPYTFYVGFVAGGVWKTTNTGATWLPISDHSPIVSVGAIAVAPSNSNIIYVGTGEAAPRGNITWGNGIYKSSDGGKTWNYIGLNDNRHTGAVIVDPKNPNIVLVAAMGHMFGPNNERGVYRTTDGGKTWKRMLYKNDETGAIDVEFDPNNSKIVFAALWQARRQPWNFSSGGLGSGLYRSTDGGLTWGELKGNGLPSGLLGRIKVTVSGANSKRVYAMIEAAEGGLFRSDDGGLHWTRINDDGRLRQRAWYFSQVFADPRHVDTIYALNTGMFRSTDGGKTFTLLPARHGDHHGLWIDPTNPDRMINASDGGASVSVDGGKTWSTQDNQATAQFYHVSVDNRFPYFVYGAQQDNSNVAITSRSDEGSIGPRDWYPAGGGEAGYVIADPRDADIIYSNNENQIWRYNRHTRQSQIISPMPLDVSGRPAADLEHRFNWTSPLMLSSHNPDTLYTGMEAVYKSTDDGHSWKVISGDLTRNDRSKQIASGGPIQKDITSVEYYDTIFTISESPLQRGLLWVGTDDGLVQLTSDDGGHWTNVTPPEIPEWGSVSSIDPSHFDAGTAYISVDRHKADDIHPYIFMTNDSGKSWMRIGNGIPEGAVVHVVREDPIKRGLLFAGTETGVYVSFDKGANWQSLQLNLPESPIHDLVVKDDDLVVATHGRSFWILDDITPLRQVDPASAAQAALLYAPQKAYRLYYPDEVDSRPPVGQNPPAGALIDYYLAQPPSGDITIDILDADGKEVRHLTSGKSGRVEQPPEWPDQIVVTDTLPKARGMNRFVWNLRYDDPVQIPDAFYSGLAPRGPIVAPGHYSVRLIAGGQTQTVPLTVAQDPRVKGGDEGLRRKFTLSMQVYRDQDALHRAVNDIRAANADIAALHKRKPSPATDVLAQGDAIAGRAAELEGRTTQVKIKSSEGSLLFPVMLNEQLYGFAATLEDSDTAPTVQEESTYQSLHSQLMAELAEWAKVKTDLDAFRAGMGR